MKGENASVARPTLLVLGQREGERLVDLDELIEAPVIAVSSSMSPGTRPVSSPPNS